MRYFRAKAAQFCVFSLFSAFFTANNAHWRAQPPSRRTAAGQTARTRHFWAKPRISAFFRSFPRFFVLSRVFRHKLCASAGDFFIPPHSRRADGANAAFSGKSCAILRFFALFRVFQRKLRASVGDFFIPSHNRKTNGANAHFPGENRAIPRFFALFRVFQRKLRASAGDFFIPPHGRRADGANAAFSGKTAHFRVFSLFSAFFRTFPRFSPQIVRVGGRILHPAAQPQGGRRERAFFLAKTAQFRVFSLFSAHYADSPVQNVLFRTFYRSTGRHQFLRTID